ncbi:MAG: 2-dehydropantoate 2-reductase [Bacteroidales bacterium]|nr:2-dehydropantoate 2-reductase [Bacteroidales bacterium]
MKYAVIGSGAIGAYYGAKLVKAGQYVEFLFHSDYEFVKQNGLRVKSCDGDFYLPEVKAFDSTEKMGKADVVLVGLKSTNENLLYKVLSPLLHEKTLVVLIQNGIGLEADLQEKFPGTYIAAGLAFICSAKTEPGTVNHQCYGSINIGNFSCPDSSIINKVVEDFRNAEIEANEVEYHEARWKKAVWNMPFNGMTVALNTQTDKLLANPATEALIYMQMKEVIDAAQACGVQNLDYTFADKMIAMTKAMVPYSPSMKLDFDFKRKMEIYYIYTRPIEEARKHGYEMHKLQMLEAELKFIESNYELRNPNYELPH